MQKRLRERIANKIAEKEEVIKQLKSEIKYYKKKIKSISKEQRNFEKEIRRIVVKTLRKLQDKKLERSISRMIDKEFESEKNKLHQLSNGS